MSPIDAMLARYALHFEVGEPPPHKCRAHGVPNCPPCRVKAGLHANPSERTARRATPRGSA